jgi:hypothetical protein
MSPVYTPPGAGVNISQYVYRQRRYLLGYCPKAKDRNHAKYCLKTLHG